MFMPHDCKYNICSGRRNGLMSGGSINNCGVNVGTNVLDESDSTHWKNQSILPFDVSLDPCNVYVFLTPQSYHSEVWDNQTATFFWQIETSLLNLLLVSKNR